MVKQVVQWMSLKTDQWSSLVYYGFILTDKSIKLNSLDEYV